MAVTSQQATKLGDIITATGRLTTNKDIGSGYKYAVLLEDALLKQVWSAVQAGTSTRQGRLHDPPSYPAVMLDDGLRLG